jgi:hypothetical protein
MQHCPVKRQWFLERASVRCPTIHCRLPSQLSHLNCICLSQSRNSLTTFWTTSCFKPHLKLTSEHWGLLFPWVPFRPRCVLSSRVISVLLLRTHSIPSSTAFESHTSWTNSATQCQPHAFYSCTFTTSLEPLGSYIQPTLRFPWPLFPPRGMHQSIPETASCLLPMLVSPQPSTFSVQHRLNSPVKLLHPPKLMKKTKSHYLSSDDALLIREGRLPCRYNSPLDVPIPAKCHFCFRSPTYTRLLEEENRILAEKLHVRPHYE